MSAVDGIDEFAAQLAGILKEKNAAYGDSFARVPTVLAMFYPNVPPEVLENILFTARILDKLGRIAQDPHGAGEDAYLDTAGYAMMGANGQRLKREAKSGAAQREAMPGLNIDSIYDEPGVEAPGSPSEPTGRIKRGMAHAEVTQEPTGWYIVCFEGRDRQFFNDFGVFWAHDIRDATSFPSQEAAELCLRRREGSPHVVQTGSIIERPHTSHRVSGDGWVVCRNGRYLNCGDGAWNLFPDWGTQFSSKEAAEIVAQKVDSETGKWEGPPCE